MSINDFKYAKKNFVSSQLFALKIYAKIRIRGFTKAFKNLAKSHYWFIFAKFKYFAKQIVYLESPDYPFENDI